MPSLAETDSTYLRNIAVLSHKKMPRNSVTTLLQCIKLLISSQQLCCHW